MRIRPALPSDGDTIWAILEPTIRAGETYTLPADISRLDALAYWMSPDHEVFVAEENGSVVGTYFLRANQRGGGSHVCNCGYAATSRRRKLQGAVSPEPCVHILWITLVSAASLLCNSIL